MSTSFVATVKAFEQLDTGEYTTNLVTVATQQFETITEACKYCEMEAHGLRGADWTVSAKLSFKKACSTVAASRNRALFMFLGVDVLDAEGNNLRVQSSIELKAPQICKILQQMELRVNPDKQPELCSVRMLVTKNHMIVG